MGERQGIREVKGLREWAGTQVGGWGYRGYQPRATLRPRLRSRVITLGQSSLGARPASAARTHPARARPSSGRAAPPPRRLAAVFPKPRPGARPAQGPPERTPGDTGAQCSLEQPMPFRGLPAIPERTSRIPRPLLQPGSQRTPPRGVMTGPLPCTLAPELSTCPWTLSP